MRIMDPLGFVAKMAIGRQTKMNHLQLNRARTGVYRSSHPTFNHPMRTTLLLCSTLMTVALHAQSISGNLNAGSIDARLGYGNVDIYRGEKLVASVLTDERGNFNVRLDTGLYRCVVNYDGYGSRTKMVRVRADEKVDFTVSKEEGPAEHAPRTKESRVARGYATMLDRTGPSETGPSGADMAFYNTSSLPNTYNQRASTAAMEGVLTAGEVNDFSKWTQWTDLSVHALADLRRIWGIAPGGRYTVDVQNKQGLPLADAVVRLSRVDGTVLYQARTDNTGKAELWATLDAKDTLQESRMYVDVAYGGHSIRVNDTQPFSKSMNQVVVDVPCGPNDAVDVAFVVDATGSMDDELSFLKAEMNDIIYKSKQIGDQLNFRFANVFYRDAGPAEEYTTRSMDFTRVLSTAVNFISAQRAGGGGDTPEAVDIALDSAINGLDWSAKARARLLFLVLDAGPHLTPAVKQRMLELTAQAAAKGIRIVPVAASGTDKATEYLLRSMALGTNGTYTFLTDHSGVGLNHLAPTTDHFDVESLNNLLVRVLKSCTYMPDCEQQLPELTLDYPDSTVTAVLLPDSSLSVPEGGSAAVNVRWNYWPNPTSGLVYITADAVIPELYLTDLSGKVLQVVLGLQQGRTVEVDLGAYATGIYLLRCPVGDAWRSGKVLLQRG
jgi:hypothetical protein